MEKIVAIILSFAMALSLVGCGDKPEPEIGGGNENANDSAAAEDNPPAEAVEDTSAPDVEDENPLTGAVDAIARVWDAYAEEDRFMTFGGDYNEENQVENAPGVHSIATEDDAAMLDDATGFPAEMVGKIGEAAAMRHMLNVNTFTCGAYAVIDPGDVDAVCQGIRDGLMNRSYMCGWPEVLYVVTLPNNFVMNVFGARDLVDKFIDTAKQVYGDGLSVYCEEDMSEAGGDNTFAFPVPELDETGDPVGELGRSETVEEIRTLVYELADKYSVTSWGTYHNDEGEPYCDIGVLNQENADELHDYLIDLGYLDEMFLVTVRDYPSAE